MAKVNPNESIAVSYKEWSQFIHELGYGVFWNDWTRESESMPFHTGSVEIYHFGDGSKITVFHNWLDYSGRAIYYGNGPQFSITCEFTAY